MIFVDRERVATFGTTFAFYETPNGHGMHASAARAAGVALGCVSPLAGCCGRRWRRRWQPTRRPRRESSDEKTTPHAGDRRPLGEADAPIPQIGCVAAHGSAGWKRRAPGEKQAPPLQIARRHAHQRRSVLEALVRWFDVRPEGLLCLYSG